MTSLTLPLSLCTALLCLAGCYDHRITQAIVERRRAAKQAEGSEIRPMRITKTAKHTGALKLYVAADYRAQHPNWKQELLDLVDSANGVLIPSFGVRLEPAQKVEWEPACDGSALEPCLKALAEADPGAEGEWVVGVMGAQARFIDAFDELGMANAPGRHMLLRDVSDLAERDAIDRAFPALGQERRDEIYRHRKQHKRLAIFLHEWAHTLGAKHSTDSSSLLFPRYDDRMAGFDDPTSELLASAIETRFEQASAALAQQSAPVPGAGPSTEGSPSAPRSAYVVQGQDDELVAALSKDDRAQYERAAQRAHGQSPRDAYTELEPLVARYPDCYAVQHLACGLLMQLGRQADVQTVCSRVQALSSRR